MRVEQYLKIDEPHVPYKERIISSALPRWFDDNRMKYIPGVQGKYLCLLELSLQYYFSGGWQGPIVSFYSREDSKLRPYW